MTSVSVEWDRYVGEVSSVSGVPREIVERVLHAQAAIVVLDANSRDSKVRTPIGVYDPSEGRIVPFDRYSAAFSESSQSSFSSIVSSMIKSAKGMPK